MKDSESDREDNEAEYEGFRKITTERREDYENHVQ